MKSERMVSLTTRLSVRDYIAVAQIAKRNNMTESAWVRWLITNTVDVHTEPVNECDIHDMIALDASSKTSVRKHKKVSWWRKICRVGG